MKIKFLSIAIGLILITSGCSWLFSERFQEFNDEFRDSKKTIVRMLIEPRERNTEINSARIIFERERSVKNETVKAYFVINRSSSSFRTAPTGFLRIDNEIYEVTIDNILSEHKSKNETSASSYVSSDSTKVSSGSSIDTETHNWIDDKFMFSLTSDMISKIPKAKILVIRFDFGPIPGTFRIRRADLIWLKRIFRH